jgi:hypothetical protein
VSVACARLTATRVAEPAGFCSALDGHRQRHHGVDLVRPRRLVEHVKAGLAKLRQGTPYSVAAAFVGEMTPSGMDGVRWRVYVTDGHTSGYVDAELTGTNGRRDRDGR